MVLDIITYALCRKNGGGGGGDNTHFIGTTTTAITDGATTNPITVDGKSYTAVKGDIIIYDGTEFIFDGSAWQSFGGTMDAQPTQNSAKAVTSDGVYRYTAGQREYVNDTLKGEIFNTYSGNGKNIASGTRSHAEGFRTKASDNYSHAEGFSTTASGESSHAEGFDTEAWGAYSHAEGRATDAHAAYSHVSGWGTRANTAASTVIGTYNVIDGTRSVDPKHLFIVGNGLDDNNRSNILEVSDTYLNLNGVFKQNGQVIDFTTLGDEIIEMSDIEYDALATKDPDKVYFVYEAEEDNRSIICKDSNGNWKYTTTIIGTTASNITGNVTAEESTVTTPPTPGFDYWYGNVVFRTETPEKTVYHSMFYFSNNGRAGMRDTASGDGAPDAYFELGTNGSITYHPTPSGSPVSGLYVFSSSHRVSGDTIEFNVNSKSNGFKRIYMGDELYATLNPTPIEEVSTITATTTEQSITFTEDCDYVWFRNLGDNDCYVSNHSNILIGADDVAIVKAGGGTRIAVPVNKTVYIKSAQDISVVEVHGQNSECAPFKPSGGTPNEYIKDATINSSTGSLTLTKKDGTTVILPVSSVPAENSTTLINSDGIYRNTAGKRYYVQGSHAGGEIFNCYMGNGENIASGAYSHAEGWMTTASNDEAHAEGYSTIASGVYSHAEGELTTSSGNASHAEGWSTTASGNFSHTEGNNTSAIGAASHAGGEHTIANTEASTVIGRYNVADGTSSSDPKHLLIVGNGLTDNNRSNILEVSSTYLNVNGDIKKNGVALGSLAMKSSASGTAVTTVGTLPSLTYDSTTESFTFSAGTLPTTGTVTVS